MSVFNGAPFVSESIQSILHQDLLDLELVIINDGSTDGTADILEFYRGHDSRVRVYHQKNCGLIAALNRGCSLARAPYIARMDADDIAEKFRLKCQLTFLERNERVALLGGAAEFIDGTGRPLFVVRPPLDSDAIRRHLPESNVFLHPTMVFRQDAFFALGGYRNVTHAEDYDLWLRFAERHEMANLSQVILKYRVHSGQISVRKCREQALGASVAQAAARVRSSGRNDPLCVASEVTPELVAKLGITERSLQTELARTYLSTIRNMTAIGEHTLALSELEKLSFTDFALAQTWVVADLRLQAAALYWRKGKRWQSLMSAVQGLCIRPMICGRPLKRFWVGMKDTLSRWRSNRGRSLGFLL